MRHLFRSFTLHPSSVGESYFEHMRAAFSFGWTMLAGGLACIVHGVFPFLCTRTGSECISDLHRRMVTHRTARSIGSTALDDGAKSHV